MEEILVKAVIISLCILAIWGTMWYGMIFQNIRDINIPEWLKKPLYDCPICQTPWYGSVLYWILMPGSIKEWILVIIVSMGIVTFFVKIKNS